MKIRLYLNTGKEFVLHAPSIWHPAWWCMLMLILTLGSCVEPYEPEVGDYNSTLVVDGLFSNSEDPSKVVLSRSFPYQEDEVEFIQGATVIIEDDQGVQAILEEKEEGTYYTDPASYPGKVGRSYRIRITTPDGNQFESDFQLMKPAPPIEDIYFKVEERIPDDPNARPIRGIQFYLNTRDTENNTRYYRWEFVETYQYPLIHMPFIEVKFGSPPATGKDEIINIHPNDREGTWCWKTEESARILIATTENFSEDIIQDFPLHYVDTRTSRLYIRYSILTKQYALSEADYRNLRKIKEINQTTGSLFDPIPNEIFGNVRSVDGKDLPVLGYFSVAGVSELRTFVNRAELPLGFGAARGPSCVTDTLDLDFQELYSGLRGGQFVLYDYLYPLIGPPIGYLLTEPPCANCAVSDATNQKPDFW